MKEITAKETLERFLWCEDLAIQMQSGNTLDRYYSFILRQLTKTRLGQPQQDIIASNGYDTDFFSYTISLISAVQKYQAGDPEFTFARTKDFVKRAFTSLSEIYDSYPGDNGRLPMQFVVAILNGFVPKELYDDDAMELFCSKARTVCAMQKANAIRGSRQPMTWLLDLDSLMDAAAQGKKYVTTTLSSFYTTGWHTVRNLWLCKRIMSTVKCAPALMDTEINVYREMLVYLLNMSIWFARMENSDCERMIIYAVSEFLAGGVPEKLYEKKDFAKLNRILRDAGLPEVRVEPVHEPNEILDMNDPEKLGAYVGIVLPKEMYDFTDLNDGLDDLAKRYLEKKKNARKSH